MTHIHKQSAHFERIACSLSIIVYNPDISTGCKPAMDNMSALCPKSDHAIQLKYGVTVPAFFNVIIIPSSPVWFANVCATSNLNVVDVGYHKHQIQFYCLPYRYEISMNEYDQK